ncbi:tetratricopeptide repeat protein [Candidatus Saccharibacteria bacterium]|nr:tetratricopeptide repeat protein [Candidatus Saccharibacteria bacterium]
MVGIGLIALLCVGLIFFVPRERGEDEDDEISSTLSGQLDKLWKIAQDAIKEQKVMRAEKALLTILKFDERNAAAYNRLGILYAKQRQFKEAIECFEIAQSLDSNASSLHNVGLICLETGKYEKAAMAFEQALEMEGDLPNRYIAYAKAQENLGNVKKAVEALEMAFMLDKSPQILRQMLIIYANEEDAEKVEETKARLVKLLEERREKASKQKRPGKFMQRQRKVM